MYAVKKKFTNYWQNRHRLPGRSINLLSSRHYVSDNNFTVSDPSCRTENAASDTIIRKIAGLTMIDDQLLSETLHQSSMNQPIMKHCLRCIIFNQAKKDLTK